MLPPSIKVTDSGVSRVAIFILYCCYFPLEGEWAGPGGTAKPGQPVEKSEQAPASSPSFKNQFNIDGPQWGPYQILS